MQSKAAVFTGFFLFSLVAFADQRFLVLDTAGAPVADAVIMAQGEPPVPDAQPRIMDQIDKTFVPLVLTVPAGQAVAFPNSDDIRHHVYSFSDPKPFELKLYKGTPGAPVVFDQPGVVVLGCNIHDSMVGYILVTDTARWGQTDSEGIATLPGDNAVSEVRIWHPRLSVNADRIDRVKVNPAEEVHAITLSLQPPEPEPEKSGFNSNRFNRYGR